MNKNDRVGSMKIILINNLYGEYARGGAERVISVIADELVRQKHKVIVISSRPFSKLEVRSKKLENDEITSSQTPRNDSGVTRYSLLVTRYFFFPWNLISYYNLGKLPVALRLVWHLIDMFNIQSYFKIKTILQREKPDLVMTHNLMGVGFLTPLAIKRAGIKHIHTLHDIQLLHPSGLMNAGEERKINNVFARIYQWINKKLFSKADVVISPSEWLMKMHKDKGFFKKAKCEVLCNPVITSSSPFLVRGGDSDGSIFTFLYVGQIEKHKGIQLLIDTFSQFNKDKCKLLIAGEGNWEISNIQYPISNIQFLGKKNHEEVQELMCRAKCLVVPSLCYENQPTVIIEAQQNGLPVIASDIGGIPEILKPEFLFKAGDREELIKKMKWVMDSYDKIKDTAISEKSISRSSENYIDKILKL